MSESQRQRVADELRQVREAVRDRAPRERPTDVLPPPLPPRPPEPISSVPAAGDPPPLHGPDRDAVRAQHDLSRAAFPTGARGSFSRLTCRWVAPWLEAQSVFNSRQVRFDDALFEYLDARCNATRDHYRDVLAIHTQHLREIDERHLILQEELLAHLRDLAKRIDAALSEVERGRQSVEIALQETQDSLALIERRLGGAPK